MPAALIIAFMSSGFNSQLRERGPRPQVHFGGSLAWLSISSPTRRACSLPLAVQMTLASSARSSSLRPTAAIASRSGSGGLSNVSGGPSTGPVAIFVGIDWRVFGRHEAIRSCGEVNDLIVWFLGEGLPSVDLAHGDLS